MHRTWSRLRSFAFAALLIAATAASFPRWWCGRDAAAWLAGDVATQRALADVVAARATRGISPGDLQTGSALFDGEWALVTNQMSVLGLGQIVRAHPSERSRFVPAVRAAVARMLQPEARAFGTRAWNEDGFAAFASDHGHAYLGYLGMALGMARWIDGATAADVVTLHDALIDSLARRLDAAPHALIETYPGVTFPADTASVAAAIALHDLSTGSDRHRELLGRWVARFRRDCIDRETGFVYQTVDPERGVATGPPRGSGTALVAYFVGFVDPTLSRDIDRALASRGRASVLGFGGVREYARAGDTGLGDMDSGPVLFGVSIAATGFALGAAHRFHDTERFTELFRTAVLFGAPVSDRTGRGFLVGSGLGDAILLAMLTSGEVSR